MLLGLGAAIGAPRIAVASQAPPDFSAFGTLIHDYDATVIANLFQNSNKTTPVTANNDLVGAWVDTVSGADALQATSGNRPQYKTNQQNGLAAIQLAAGKSLGTPGIIPSENFLAAFVAKLTSTANGSEIFSSADVLLYAQNGEFLLTTTGDPITLPGADTSFRVFMISSAEGTGTFSIDGSEPVAGDEMQLGDLVFGSACQIGRWLTYDNTNGNAVANRGAIATALAAIWGL